MEEEEEEDRPAHMVLTFQLLQVEKLEHNNEILLLKRVLCREYLLFNSNIKRMRKWPQWVKCPFADPTTQVAARADFFLALAVTRLSCVLHPSKESSWVGGIKG